MIYIPTYGRPNRQPTADALQAAGMHFCFVLSKNDELLATYRRLIKQEYYNADIAVANVATISEKRDWILSKIGPKIIMLDDDLTFYARRRAGNFTKSTPNDVRRMFKWLNTALDKFAHAGVIDKFMSQAAPRGSVQSRRYNSVLAYNKMLFPYPRPKFRIPVSEEHDVHLQLASKGLPPAVSCEFSKNTSYYNEGGCTDERTKHSELAGHKAFAALWPDLVTVVKSKSSLSGHAIKVRWAKSVGVGK